MRKITVLFCLSLGLNLSWGQNEAFTSSLYETYEEFKEPTLDKRRIKHRDIQPLISKWKSDPAINVTQVGASIEGRSLQLISMGTGTTDVFLWSQMHGNEPTATQAIFDILNFFAGSSFEAEKRDILSQLKIHFLPMLNPDGAEVFQRRNTLGIDINRDALRLQSPEGQTLKRVRDSLEADFGFNLHDQSTYYNAERTEKPATISYLAPPFNYERDVNESRGAAMQVIVYMNNIIQKYAPGQVGRYSDEFEPRAFGDNIQKWGTSTILIESGGYPSDREKQEIRKLNYVSIISALYTIAKGNYKDIPLEDYEKIPENDRKLFDLKIENVTYPLLGNDYIMDIGIHRLEVDLEGHDDFWYSSRIIDQGDLSTYYGYETFDGEGYTIVPGKVYPEVMTANNWSTKNVLNYLKQGYTYIKVKRTDADQLYSMLPLHMVKEGYELPEFRLEVGRNPTFILEKEGKPAYAVVNGFLIDLSLDTTRLFIRWKAGKANAMIFR
ncbi:M14 family metallopeptidase [Lentiprolixibacter aurantiacus]|uniref:M14 family metallopeptidase n=1 Tax=Lentiprolixibacter aurantiacus TaxID=2993939 RepID=A0AAE3SNJ3_9FLAO|nr:M14 metallopeptidase family protein [Lentiprolixibacter aurantiacus]MCX2719595.1 M14 family metallopeptidase [Lentiprolixibacter aurantiacus]